MSGLVSLGSQPLDAEGWGGGGGKVHGGWRGEGEDGGLTVPEGVSCLRNGVKLSLARGQCSPFTPFTLDPRLRLLWVNCPGHAEVKGK